MNGTEINSNGTKVNIRFSVIHPLTDEINFLASLSKTEIRQISFMLWRGRDGSAGRLARRDYFGAMLSQA